MNNRIFEQVGVGSTVALITAVINQAFAGQLNYWWVVGGFFAAVVLYTAYQNSGYPFIKFHVTNKHDNKGLLCRNDRPDLVVGKSVGEAWQFKASGNDYQAIYGPYIREPLRKGKYRTTFRIRV